MLGFKKLDMIALAIYSFLLPFMVGVATIWSPERFGHVMIDGGYRYFDVLYNILISIVTFEHFMVSVPFYLMIVLVSIFIWRK